MMSLILCSCGGRPLSQREIVRGVLFTHQKDLYSVCLVLANQKEEGKKGEAVVAAQGITPAQALQMAEESLQGEAYYGLLDLAALPTDVTWQTAREIGNLLYENVQPAPELSVFLLEERLVDSWAKRASDLYHDMKAVEATYKVHCGLQQLFVQEDFCAIPVYDGGSGYNFSLLAKGAAPIRCYGLAEAQLAAVLCGQSNRLQGVYHAGGAFVSARAQVTVDGSTVQLHLRDCEYKALTNSSEDLPKLLSSELQSSFSSLYAKMRDLGVDPFHLDFWHSCTFGPGRMAGDPRLDVLFES